MSKAAAVTSNPDDRVASRARGRKRRQEIIDAARDLLIDGGYANFTLRDVAARAGAQLGTLHYYFSTKDELLYAIFDQEIVWYTEGIRKAAETTSTTTGRLTAIVDAALLEQKQPRMVLWRTLIALALHDPKAAELLASENRIFARAFADQLLNIEPGLGDERAQHIARMILTMLDGFASQHGYNLPETPETLAIENDLRALIVMLVQGKASAQ